VPQGLGLQAATATFALAAGSWSDNLAGTAANLPAQVSEEVMTHCS